MIKVGQKVRFKNFGRYEDGVVHFIHRTHHWFNIEYGGDEGKRLIGFKFDDIDKDVKLVEE